MKIKLDTIINLLSKGDEPEFLRINTLQEDCKVGYSVDLVWLHHDGPITQVTWNGTELEDILDLVISWLTHRNAEFGEVSVMSLMPPIK